MLETTPMPAFMDFADLRAKEAENFALWAAYAATGAYVAAYDPYRWELCHFYMTADLDKIQKLTPNALVYDVHHIS